MNDQDGWPVRKRYIPRAIGDWFPYVVFAIIMVGLVFLASWCGAMHDQDCRDRGGDHLVRSGRYTHLCVSADGRIIE